MPNCSFNAENVNLADMPEHAALVVNLGKVLHTEWRAQLPRPVMGGP